MPRKEVMFGREDIGRENTDAGRGEVMDDENGWHLVAGLARHPSRERV